MQRMKELLLSLAGLDDYSEAKHKLKELSSDIQRLHEQKRLTPDLLLQCLNKFNEIVEHKKNLSPKDRQRLEIRIQEFQSRFKIYHFGQEMEMMSPDSCSNRKTTINSETFQKQSVYNMDGATSTVTFHGSWQSPPLEQSYPKMQTDEDKPPLENDFRTLSTQCEDIEMQDVTDRDVYSSNQNFSFEDETKRTRHIKRDDVPKIHSPVSFDQNQMEKYNQDNNREAHERTRQHDDRQHGMVTRSSAQASQNRESSHRRDQELPNQGRGESASSRIARTSAHAGQQQRQESRHEQKSLYASTPRTMAPYEADRQERISNVLIRMKEGDKKGATKAQDTDECDKKPETMLLEEHERVSQFVNEDKMKNSPTSSSRRGEVSKTTSHKNQDTEGSDRFKKHYQETRNQEMSKQSFGYRQQYHGHHGNVTVEGSYTHQHCQKRGRDEPYLNKNRNQQETHNRESCQQNQNLKTIKKENAQRSENEPNLRRSSNENMEGRRQEIYRESSEQYQHHESTRTGEDSFKNVQHYEAPRRNEHYHKNKDQQETHNPENYNQNQNLKTAKEHTLTNEDKFNVMKSGNENEEGRRQEMSKAGSEHYQQGHANATTDDYKNYRRCEKSRQEEHVNKNRNEQERHSRENYQQNLKTAKQEYMPTSEDELAMRRSSNESKEDRRQHISKVSSHYRQQYSTSTITGENYQQYDERRQEHCVNKNRNQHNLENQNQNLKTTEQKYMQRSQDELNRQEHERNMQDQHNIRRSSNESKNRTSQESRIRQTSKDSDRKTLQGPLKPSCTENTKVIRQENAKSFPQEQNRYEYNVGNAKIIIETEPKREVRGRGKNMRAKEPDSRLSRHESLQHIESKTEKQKYEEEHHRRNPGVAQRINSDDSRPRSYHGAPQTEEHQKPIEVAQEVVEDKPLEILDVHQYFRDDFDLKSLDSTVDAMTQIETVGNWAKTFEDKVGNFSEAKYSLEFFVLDEKLMRLIEHLDKLKCREDKAATKRKIEVIEYIKELQETLDKNAIDE